MRPIPSIARIVQTDYAARLGLLFPLLAWALVLGALFFDREAVVSFRYIAPFATVAGLSLLFWRYRMISQTYEDGSRTTGVLTNAGFFRGRGRIYYTYTVSGRKHLISNAVNVTARTRALSPGQEVTVTYHPHQPSQAFVDELYL